MWGGKTPSPSVWAMDRLPFPRGPQGDDDRQDALADEVLKVGFRVELLEVVQAQLRHVCTLLLCNLNLCGTASHPCSESSLQRAMHAEHSRQPECSKRASRSISAGVGAVMLVHRSVLGRGAAGGNTGAASEADAWVAVGVGTWRGAVVSSITFRRGGMPLSRLLVANVAHGNV